MEKIVLFTHIPKTAGTSFKESVIYPNVERIRKFSGFKDLILNRRKDFDAMEGHYPYGVHYFIPAPVYYITILRKPLDHAISYYHFVKQCDYSNYKHPSLEDAKRYDLQTFYTLPKYANMQTKFIAGFPFNRMGAVIGQKRLLAIAKKNLTKRYHSFGLLSQIDLYQEHVAKEFGWKNMSIVNQSKQTRSRPKEMELSASVRHAIEQSNALDFELYRFAEQAFNRRFGIA